MSGSKIKKNFIYNISYEIFRVMVPLITTPYISRVLGSEGIGTFTIANTYAQYFVLFAGLGFATYAARELAYVRDDKQKIRSTFWEIFIARAFLLSCAIIVYFIVFFVNDYKPDIAYKICLIYLVSEVFNISYYFQATENFKTIVIRNVFIKFVSLVCIFAFIRNGSQVWLYTLILATSELIGQVIMVLSLDRGLFRRSEIKFINFKKHFLMSISLFIPTIAIQIYTMLDKLMLGEIWGESETGYYENAQKMVRLAATVASAMVSVSTPIMAYHYAKGEVDVLRNHFKKVFSFVSFLVFPMCFGLIGVASSFSNWYYGPNFIGIDKLVVAGSVLIISLGWSSILGNMILIATNNQKYYSIAVYFGAALNVILNFILIPKLGAMGAIIASVLAELSGMIFMFYYSHKKFGLADNLSVGVKYIIPSFIMMIVIKFIDNFMTYNIFGTAVEIIAGCAVYGLIMLVIKDENTKQFIEMLKGIVKKYIPKVRTKDGN